MGIVGRSRCWTAIWLPIVINVGHAAVTLSKECGRAAGIDVEQQCNERQVKEAG